MNTKLAVLALLCAVACGCGAPQDGGEQTCSGFDLDVEKVWNAEIKAKVMGYGGEIGGEMGQKIATKMDHVTRDWVMLREAACRDHERGLLTTDEYKAQVKCFDAFLQNQRSLLSALEAGGGADVANQLIAGQEVSQCQM